MPWSVSNNPAACSASKPWAVTQTDSGEVVGCHATESAAHAQQAALYANTEEESKMLTAPREDLIRMNTQIRATDDGRTLVGYAAVFDNWTEINSWEGRFRERLMHGAFKRTLNNNRSSVKVLFNHGMDPTIGDKPLGKPRTMKEDDRGLYVEVPLDDTSYNRDIIASLDSGALDGMSFRMSVIREEWDRLESDLPERTIQEVRLYEFGPVTFPAYEATEAGVRAHAPKAFAAFQRSRSERDDPQCQVCAARAMAPQMTSYVPVMWPGWDVTTAGTTTTTPGIVMQRAETTPAETVASDTDEEIRDANDADETTDVASDSDTMPVTGDSPDSGDSPDNDRSASPDAGDADTETRDDSPDSGDSSETEDDVADAEIPRMSLTRKSIFVDHKLGEILERELTSANSRYSHLL